MAKELTWKGMYHGIFSRGSGCRYSRYCYHEINLDVEHITDTPRVYVEIKALLGILS